jgi:hypothetical protein
MQALGRSHLPYEEIFLAVTCTECSFNRREYCFCYPPVPIAYPTLPSFEVCLLFYYRHCEQILFSCPGLKYSALLI